MQEYTATYETLTDATGGGQLTLFPGDSPASHTAAQASDLEGKMTATSGQRCLELFGRLPRVGLWAKTFAGLLVGRSDWYSTRCNLIWRLPGTKSGRSYFLLQVSTPPTDGTGFCLLPTVRANKWGLPDSHGNTEAWNQLLPTPQESDKKNGHRNPTKRIQRKMELGWNIQLNDRATLGLIPTPKASKSGECLRSGMSGQLNPRFVEWMMGFPAGWTELPPSETQ